MHDPLDQLLSRRAVPEMRHDLSERIIAAALRSPQRRPWSLQETLQNFADLFVLPQPAFALSIVLLTGFVLGFGGHIKPSFASSANDEMVAKIGLADESFEEGAFL